MPIDKLALVKSVRELTLAAEANKRPLAADLARWILDHSEGEQTADQELLLMTAFKVADLFAISTPDVSMPFATGVAQIHQAIVRQIFEARKRAEAAAPNIFMP